MDTLTAVLCALATARLTKLITTDRILLAPRAWLVRRLPEHHLLAYLIVCDWCVSVYTGAAVAGAWWAWGGSTPFTAGAAALAFSYAAGFLASRESE